MLQTVVLKKNLESPLDCREIKLVNPEYSLEGLILKLKLQYFGHLMQRVDSLEKTLILGKIEGRRRRGWHRMRWLDNIKKKLIGLKPEKTQGDSIGHGRQLCCSLWACKELLYRLSNWTATTIKQYIHKWAIYKESIIIRVRKYF